MNFIQFFYIITIAFFGYKLSLILNESTISMVLGFVGYLLALILWFGIMPSMLDTYATITCIEMMKNRESIDNVIKHQKFEKAKISFRIY